MQKRIDRIESFFIIKRNRIAHKIVDFNKTFKIIHAIKRARIE